MKHDIRRGLCELNVLHVLSVLEIWYSICFLYSFLSNYENYVISLEIVCFLFVLPNMSLAVRKLSWSCSWISIYTLSKLLLGSVWKRNGAHKETDYFASVGHYHGNWILTARKISKCGVLSGRYFPVFSPSTGRYWPEKLRIWTFFTHWLPLVVRYELWNGKKTGTTRLWSYSTVGSSLATAKSLIRTLYLSFLIIFTRSSRTFE